MSGISRDSYNRGSTTNTPDDVLDVAEVCGDGKVRLIKDVREALGVKLGGKLVWVKVEGGCFVKKRESARG